MLRFFFYLFLYNDSRDMQTHTQIFYTNGSMHYLYCSTSCFFHEYGSDIVFFCQDTKYFLILLYSGSVFYYVGGS